MEINAHTLSTGLYLPPKTQQLIKKTMRTKYLFLLLIGLMLVFFIHNTAIILYATIQKCLTPHDPRQLLKLLQFTLKWLNR